MSQLKLTYILLIVTLGIVACKQTKYVPDGRYLLKKNDVVTVGDKLDKYEVDDLIRQHPNYKSFGIKWKLLAFNLIDSSKVADKRIRKNEKLRQTNSKRLAKQERINTERMHKAAEKGKTYYTEKIVTLKDTLDPPMFFREWYKYKIGRAPVVFDSLRFNKTLEQMSAYLRSKGYYYGNVNGFVKYKRNKKCVVTYAIETGKPYRIDSLYFVSENPLVVDRYADIIGGQLDTIVVKGSKRYYLNQHDMVNDRLDKDKLDDHRRIIAKEMRNRALFGFSSTSISYVIDTNKRDLTATVGVLFTDRFIKPVNKDTLIRTKHVETYINHVVFHLADTSRYTGDFKSHMEALGLSLYDGQFLRTIDTTYYTSIKDPKTGQLDVTRVAVFYHNGKLVVKPRILEAQNYLERDELYSERDLEKSYLSLLQLNVFEAVKTEVKESGEPGCVDIHYYLKPSRKQSFSFEPKATNSNGFLGVSATINYVNRNLLKGAEKLTMSLSGGFESQPPVFDQNVNGEKIQTAARSFNTFEIGPSSSVDIPGLFPLRLRNFAKRLRPKTVISTAYNYQNRVDFERGTFQMNYLWRFYAKKTMIFQSGLPFMSVIKFVNIHKTDEFSDKLNELNDLFLINAYSNQFIWQDWKFTFEYNIKDKENRKGNSQLYFLTSFDPAGNIFGLFRKFQDTLPNGQHAILGIGYSQFSRFDNELIFSKPIGKTQSVNFRVEAGAGIPYGNTETSLPYDYAFFGGGANDNRGWRARSLGPGSYQYYLDTNRAATQIGDMRIGASFEYRFEFNRVFKGALFADAGNIWTLKEDVNRIGGNISKDWYKEIALAAGFGLRVDLDYFIIRVDLGIPIYDPAMPEGSRFIFDDRDNYYAAGEAAFGPNYRDYLPLAFIPKLHFGIGYPF